MQSAVSFSWPNFKMAKDWTLFLDRDGVINERIPGDYVKKWDDFHFLPGTLDALGIFNQFFSKIFIVTNQAGIEKELYSHEDLAAIHEQMMEYITFSGGRIDEIYYCPYKADLNPLCRKPNPGMALEAKRDFPDILFHKSLMVGDSTSDIAFGNRMGMKTILIGNRSDHNFLERDTIPDSRLDSLKDVASYVESLM
jgi:D-glycero-D-manno-heptose 1,7-bisphosphate phosphatase